MIYFEAFLVTDLLVLGGYCTYTDIKEGIIPNKAIIIGLVSGIVVHIGLLFTGSVSYYPHWIINMLIADAFALCMYLGGLWAAGDTKLFMILYFLLPPRLLDGGSLSYSVTPFIFIFVPALLWMIVDSTMRLIRREPRKQIHYSIDRYLKTFGVIIVETTAFYCLLSILFPHMITDQPLLIAAIMLVYAYICASIPFMQRWYLVLFHILVIAIAWALGRWKISIPPWQNYVWIALSIGVQRYCALYNYQLIPTNKIKKGMIPATETVVMFQASRVHSLPKDASEDLSARITEEEAAAIKRWEKSSMGRSTIWIVRKVPFAIMIYIGFILWICFRLWGR